MGIFEIVGVPHDDRNARVAELNDLGFTWANIGEEQYWIDQLVTIPSSLWQEIDYAASGLWAAFDKAARFVIGRRDLYEQLSIPEVLWDGLDKLEPGRFGRISRYARFDFAVSLSGEIRLLELNADTPTGYVESAIATPWMCEQYGVTSPNSAMAAQVRQAWAEEQPDYAACIAYGEHLEDSGTIDALVRHSGREMQCVDCLDLWVDEGALKARDGAGIDRIFALYPKEWMGIDDGGAALAYAIESGHVQLFNPLHAIILQSKGLQAIVWGLHELRSVLFTLEEHDAIRRYMLPTYNAPVFTGNYVSKSMFGREGGSVKLFNSSGELDVKDEQGFDTSVFFREVYQQRADLPEVDLCIGKARLLTGVFVIDGIPCGLLGRAGGLITGNASHFVAMGVK